VEQTLRRRVGDVVEEGSVESGYARRDSSGEAEEGVSDWVVCKREEDEDYTKDKVVERSRGSAWVRGKWKRAGWARTNRKGWKRR
jgi:hypothetical protein